LDRLRYDIRVKQAILAPKAENGLKNGKNPQESDEIGI